MSYLCFLFTSEQTYMVSNTIHLDKFALLYILLRMTHLRKQKQLRSQSRTFSKPATHLCITIQGSSSDLAPNRGTFSTRYLSSTSATRYRSSASRCRFPGILYSFPVPRHFVIQSGAASANISTRIAPSTLPARATQLTCLFFFNIRNPHNFAFASLTVAS